MTDLATMWSSLQTQLQAHRPEVSNPENPHIVTTPVCLVTGFLGSGKSTLLARLVVNPPDGLVVKAVVNDVGALPIDPTLISAGDDLRIELMNGCGCCEQTAELAVTLDALANDTETDLIVLEASGVADPLALAHIVEASQRLNLDRIVAVVDAAAMAGQLEDLLLSPIIERQIEAAHSIVLTHGDLLNADELDAAVRCVIEQAPGRVVTTSTLEVPAIDALTPAALQGAHPWPTTETVSHQFVTRSLHQTKDVASLVLVEVLSDARPGLVRAKGRLKLDGEVHLVQMTPTTMTIEPDSVLLSPSHCGLTLIATDHAATRALTSLLGEIDDSAG
jgi:G3E family GTPase